MDKKINLGKDTSSAISVDSHSTIETIWYNELLSKYIKNSGNQLTEFARQDSSIRIEWLMDRIENTDTATFLVFHIGHEVTDEGHTNLRFVTDGWVFIDTLTRLYEYDIPNDRLVKWENIHNR